MAYGDAISQMLDRWRDAATGISEALAGTDDICWATARSTYDRVLMSMFPPPAGIEERRVMAGDLSTTIITNSPDTVCTILYLHGGGYASGAAGIYRRLAADLATRTGACAVIPDYRLAPQHPYPAATDDAFAAYRALIEEGIDPTRIAIVGDSAGGALVVTTLCRIRAGGMKMPAAGVAISPWVDLRTPVGSVDPSTSNDPLVRPAFLEALATAYLGDVSREHPEASPIFSDVHGLPPMLVQIGEREVMLPGALMLATNLARSGVRVTLEAWPGMFHVWPLFTGMLDDADRAIISAATFLTAAFEPVRDAKGSRDASYA